MLLHITLTQCFHLVGGSFWSLRHFQFSIGASQRFTFITMKSELTTTTTTKTIITIAASPFHNFLTFLWTSF